MKINEVIRAKRLELGMAQEQLALRLGVSTPAVNKWERGASYPDITLIPSLARLLKTDANTLLSFQDDITVEQNLAIQRETDRLVREEGYDAGFRHAVDAMREYPSCDQLACILTMYLTGRCPYMGARRRRRRQRRRCGCGIGWQSGGISLNDRCELSSFCLKRRACCARNGDGHADSAGDAG